MDSTLRPRSASEIVDATFRLYRRHAGVMLLFAAVVTGPQLVLELLTRTASGGAGPAAGAVGVGTFVLGAYLIVMSGGFAALADDAVRTGTPDATAAIRVGLRRALACLGTGLLVGLVVVVGLVLLVVPGLYAAVRLATALPTCVVEGVGPTEAVRRAWARGRGRVGHAFVVLLLVVIVYLVPTVAAAMLGTAAVAAGGTVVGATLEWLLSSAVAVVLQPLFPLATQLLYYDLRVRGDGYDLERMVDSLGAPGAPAGPAPAGA